MDVKMQVKICADGTVSLLKLHGLYQNIRQSGYWISSISPIPFKVRDNRLASINHLCELARMIVIALRSSYPLLYISVTTSFMLDGHQSNTWIRRNGNSWYVLTMRCCLDVNWLVRPFPSNSGRLQIIRYRLSTVAIDRFYYPFTYMEFSCWQIYDQFRLYSKTKEKNRYRKVKINNPKHEKVWILLRCWQNIDFTHW